MPDQLWSHKLGPGLMRYAQRGLTAYARARGKPLDFEPVVRLLGMRLFARRFYGALIDANGASYADVDQTLARIRSLKPEAWVREWRRTAEPYERLGREAAAAGRKASAVELLTRASRCYRFAQMSLLDDSDERLALERASVDTYLLAGQCMDPSLERVCLPLGDGLEAPAYFRRPCGVERPPVVVVVPGLGMVKEHGDFPQEVLLARGLAVLTVDLPGQGESRRVLALNQENGLRMLHAAIEHLLARPDVDASRLGLLGTSMGAAAAMLTAADDHRVRALVEIAGFYYPTAWWDRFPEQIKEFLRYVMGAASQDELLAMVRPINLAGSIRRIECPLLVVHGQADQIVPFAESDLIWAEAAAPKDRLTFPDGDHGCVNIGQARPLIGDWLAEKLGAAA